jgi:hypothetical protein
MAIELSKASDLEVIPYKPYYREAIRQQALPYAISLYKQGEMAGERRIEGGVSISFTAVWRVTSLPLDTILCRVTFDGDADMSYEIALQNAEFVGYLIDVVSSLKDKSYADFPQSFYSKLFRVKVVVSEGS